MKTNNHVTLDESSSKAKDMHFHVLHNIFVDNICVVIQKRAQTLVNLYAIENHALCIFQTC